MSTTPSKPAARHSAAKSPSRSSANGDALKLLTADHKEVQGLFQQYRKLTKAEAAADEREALAAQICQALKVHTTIEEEIFYPAARAGEVDAAMLDEAEVEHDSAKELIAQLESMSADDPLYDAKVTVLGEYVMHHVKEEQDEMFPACRKAKLDLATLGEEMAARKQELMSEMPAEAPA